MTLLVVTSLMLHTFLCLYNGSLHMLPVQITSVLSGFAYMRNFLHRWRNIISFSLPYCSHENSYVHCLWNILLILIIFIIIKLLLGFLFIWSCWLIINKISFHLVQFTVMFRRFHVSRDNYYNPKVMFTKLLTSQPKPVGCPYIIL